MEKIYNHTVYVGHKKCCVHGTSPAAPACPSTPDPRIGCSPHHPRPPGSNLIGKLAVQAPARWTLISPHLFNSALFLARESLTRTATSEVADTPRQLTPPRSPPRRPPLPARLQPTSPSWSWSPAAAGDPSLPAFLYSST